MPWVLKGPDRWFGEPNSYVDILRDPNAISCDINSATRFNTEKEAMAAYMATLILRGYGFALKNKSFCAYVKAVEV